MDNSETLLHRINGVSRRNLLTGAGAVAASASASPTGATESDRSRPFPCPSILALQILNVKQGWTADGHPAPHAPTILPDNDSDFARAEYITREVFDALSTALDLDDRNRTRIIRKTIDQLRYRTAPENRAWLFGHLFLRLHPRALKLDLTFPEYAHLYREGLRRNTRLQRRKILSAIDALRAEMNPPDCPVLWTSPDGRHRFVKITHAFHVYEEGLRGAHELLKPKSETSPPDKADEINRLLHWLMIQKGCCHVYSLRGTPDFHFAATIVHTPVRTIMRAYETGARSVLKVATAAVGEHFGPNHFMATDRFKVAFFKDNYYESYIPWGSEPGSQFQTSSSDHVWPVHYRHADHQSVPVASPLLAEAIRAR